MTKRALLAVAGFLTLCVAVSAQQQTDRVNIFRTLNDSLPRFSSLALSDEQPFSFSRAVAPDLAFNWLEPVGVVDVSLPPIIVTRPRKIATVSAVSPKDDPSKEVADVQGPNFERTNPYYAGGEVGFLYGRSSGKFGGDIEQGYIIGEVGNDRFQISAGAAYEHSSGRIPRFGR